MSEEDLFEQGKNTFYLLIVIPVIFIFLFLIASLFSTFASKDFNVNELQNDINFQRFILSPNCLAFEENGNVELGVVDINKFQESILSKCFDYSKRNFGIVLRLEYGSEIKTIILNDAMVQREFLCGDKSHFCAEELFYVLVKDKNELIRGKINIKFIELK